jgi:fatty acid desaturase
MSTIQELGAFLAREQAAVTTPTQAPTPTTPATSTPPTAQAPAPDAAFNTDYNGAAAARLRSRADQAAARLGTTSGEEASRALRPVRRQLAAPELNKLAGGCMASLDRELTAGPTPPRTGRWSQYTQLSRQIKQAGLLDRRHGYYTAKLILNLVLLAGGAAFVAVEDSWWQLVTAAYLAVVFTQIAFVGHDAGHRQIFRSRRANNLIGLVHANLLVGISFGWWVPKHDRHHSNPNHEDLDPDIGIAALAFTADQATSKHGLVRLIARYQAYLFFPLLLLEAAQLHLASAKAVLQGRSRATVVEALLLLIHVAGYVSALVLVLSPLRAVLFLLIQQGLFGLYLGCSFAPNHKGMPTLSQADELDFFRSQVLTSRNVRGSRVVDFLLGGLNYQIEHHLFPNMPRPNLRRAQPLVRGFCSQHGIPYTEATMFGSYAEALRHLHTVGARLRPAQAAGD